MLGAELRRRVLRAVRADPDVMLYAARVSVWARWLGWLVGVFELAYRPGLWYATDKEYLFLSVPLLAFNGFVHYRLRRDRAVTWRWLLFLSGMDIALITAAVIIGGDFPPLQLRDLLSRPGACSRSSSRPCGSALPGRRWPGPSMPSSA